MVAKYVVDKFLLFSRNFSDAKIADGRLLIDWPADEAACLPIANSLSIANIANSFVKCR